MSESVDILTPEDVLQALKIWHDNETIRWPLAHLHMASEITEDEEGKHGHLMGKGMPAINRAILSRGLEQLATVSPSGYDILRERFEHGRKNQSVAHSMNLSLSTFQYHQRRAVEQLTQIILDMERVVRARWQAKMLGRLPPVSYEQLLGVKEPKEILLNSLTSKESGYITSIDGIGGIGKTSLADCVMRALIQTTYFDDFAWVTAKQTHLSAMGRLMVESGRPALTSAMLLDQLSEQFGIAQEDEYRLTTQARVKQHLQDTACLVVIDNLETVADYRALLPELKAWQSSSKFLLTSRHRLLDEAGVFSISLKELTSEAAAALMRMEARRIGFSDLAEAKSEVLESVYEVIGGNPLALKLVVAQLQVHSLAQVLSWFADGGLPGGEALFEYIYSEIWDSLSSENKQALMAIVWVSASDPNFTDLIEISALPAAVLAQCLENLTMLSLVEPIGTFTDRRYRLHRLTSAFLSKRFGRHE